MALPSSPSCFLTLLDSLLCPPRLVQLLHPRQQLILQLPVHRARHPIIADRDAHPRRPAAPVVNRPVLVRSAVAVLVKVQQVERRVAAVVLGGVDVGAAGVQERADRLRVEQAYDVEGREAVGAAARVDEGGIEAVEVLEHLEELGTVDCGACGWVAGVRNRRGG
jgi:hypothetical protein